jgi:hypothetical protein
MANRINTNPIALDTFGSDITVSTAGMKVSGFHFYSGTATDHFSLEDKDGVEVIHLLANTGFQPAAPVMLNNPPYTVDVSDGAYAAGARAFITL